jgi:triosephosphate isomerase
VYFRLVSTTGGRNSGKSWCCVLTGLTPLAAPRYNPQDLFASRSADLRHKYVIGNWKLNGSLHDNEALILALKSGIRPKAGASCAVCVPTPYLAQVKQLLAGSEIRWGAQDASRYEKGAYTGEVSAAMVAEFGSTFCLVGHSERRALFGDADDVVAEKLGRIKASRLIPIICVGETLDERVAGRTEQVVGRQIDALIAARGEDVLRDALFAYEPVWAIGTGKTASPQEAQQVHAFIRGRIAGLDARLAEALPILYGGSVKASNAAELLAMPDIDGGLVGGASLVAQEFIGIWSAL